jgi:hypothetical protein
MISLFSRNEWKTSSESKAGNLGKVHKTDHGEQVASSQIISLGTGDLAPPRTTCKYPFGNSTFIWTQTETCIQGPLTIAHCIHMYDQLPKVTHKYHSNLLPLCTPCYEYPSKPRHWCSWATGIALKLPCWEPAPCPLPWGMYISVFTPALILDKTLLLLCDLCVSVQFFVWDTRT